MVHGIKREWGNKEEKEWKMFSEYKGVDVMVYTSKNTAGQLGSWQKLRI